MAKKSTTKAKRRAKRSPKRPDLTLQLVKAASALVILVMMVLGAGVVANLFLGRPSEQPVAAVRPSPQYPVPTVRDAPAYEVFSPQSPPPKPLPRLPRLPGDQRPVAAIVIDDVGYDRRIAKRFMALDVPLTFAILPYSPHGRRIIKQAGGKKIEIMLHLPMEPNEYPNVQPGPGALLTAMSPDELINQLRADIDQVPGLMGVNNHMGSRISASPEQMRQIFSILKSKGLFYIDSRTTAETKAEASARLLQLPFAERDIFIDHFDDADFIRDQLRALIRRARRQGYAVGIAHPHTTTYEVLRDFLPQLQQALSLVPASMVIENAMIARNGGSHATR
ncbi:MAG: divergent polysaccharide deacetylase family protein [Desulfatitalea sp.]|nr:divergent polysaccharide deacetylase family protein [Desulfatitalea sp.]NNJ98967.1 divergent polysaccharide deacetylase family protein [Desulfatitalea sp.]